MGPCHPVGERLCCSCDPQRPAADPTIVTRSVYRKERWTRLGLWLVAATVGYNIIEAESLDAAEKLAQSNPYIASIRVYELRSM